MTTQIKLNVQTRDVKNSKAKSIRIDGYVPAVVYGVGFDNINIKIKRHDFVHVFNLAGESNLIDLNIDDKKVIKVIIKDVQKDVIKSDIIHADFYQVNMDKKIITEIPLNFIGESLAVKQLGGTVIKNMDNLEVECLPGDLVSHIDIDLGRLRIFGYLIRLNDIKLPQGMELVSKTNEVVISVTEAIKEEKIIQPTDEIKEEALAKQTKTTTDNVGKNKEEQEKKK